MLNKSKLSFAGRTLALSAMAGALSLGIAACGSASSSSATGAAGGAAVASTGSASARYQARLAYAKCMRAHGVNVPDPSPNAGPAGGGGGGGGFRALRSSPNFQSANKACASLRAKAFGFGSLSPAQQAQFQQDLVKFAQCMRAHSIDIPDPTTTTGGGFGIFRQIPDSQRNSPAFRSALQACSANLPRRPGRGGPGGPAPSGSGAITGA